MSRPPTDRITSYLLSCVNSFTHCLIIVLSEEGGVEGGGGEVIELVQKGGVYEEGWQERGRCGKRGTGRQERCLSW